MTARVTPLLFAAVLGAAASAAVASDLDEIRQAAARIEALPAIDIGNCEYRYPAFDDALDAFRQIPANMQFHQLLEHHGIPLANPTDAAADHSEQECMQALARVQAILDEYRPAIERLAPGLPPQGN